MENLSVFIRNAGKEDIVTFVKSDESYVFQLLELALTDQSQSGWRAGWILANVIDCNDQRVLERLDEIIELIPKLPHSHQREFLRIIQLMELTEEQDGVVFALAVGLWEDLGKQGSVRYNAFKCILKIADKHPELKNEIHLWSAPYYLDSLSKGIRHSIVKMLET
jgi:hypothetical protein